MAKKRFLIYQSLDNWQDDWSVQELHQKGEELDKEIDNFLQETWNDWGYGTVREAVDNLGRLPSDDELKKMLANDTDGPGNIYFLKVDEDDMVDLTKYVGNILPGLKDDIVYELEDLTADEAPEVAPTPENDQKVDNITEQAKEYETYLRLKAKFEKVA